MAFSNLLLLVFICIGVKGDELFKPCLKEDIQCLRAAAQSFLSKTYGGNSDLGIKPIDPLIIPSTDVVVNDMGLLLHYKNINITGLKNLDVTDFKLDTDKNLGLLKMQVGIALASDVEVELTKSKKTLKGPYSATLTIRGTSEYSAKLKTVKDKEYFVLGPETTNCEVVGEPTVTIGNDLQNAIDKDPDTAILKPEWETKKLAIRKRGLCEIGTHAFAAVLNNLRAVANVFDKTYFFKDV